MDEAAFRPPIATRQMNITERSSKDEIIGAACEIADAQQMRIVQLQQEQQILFAVVVALLAKILLF
jgi:hypothetical protein